MVPFYSGTLEAPFAEHLLGFSTQTLSLFNISELAAPQKQGPAEGREKGRWKKSDAPHQAQRFLKHVQARHKLCPPQIGHAN